VALARDTVLSTASKLEVWTEKMTTSSYVLCPTHGVAPARSFTSAVSEGQSH